MRSSNWTRTLTHRCRFALAMGTTLCCFTGCVSIKIGLPKPQRSKDMKFNRPPSIFKKAQSPDLDYSWRDDKNGNSISVLSECNDTPSASLQQIQEGVIDEITNSNPVEIDHITYNGSDAIHSIIDGTVDGVSTRFELVIFKKQHCTYILTYAGVANVFGDNQRDFETFVKGFQVP